MRITVNGRPEEVSVGMALAELVAARGLPRRGLAIALNLEVVTADAWESTTILAGDVVDIVTALQGG